MNMTNPQKGSAKQQHWELAIFSSFQFDVLHDVYLVHIPHQGIAFGTSIYGEIIEHWKL